MALFCLVASRIRHIGARSMSFGSNKNIGAVPRPRWRLAAAAAASLVAASIGGAAAQMAIPGKFQVNPAGAATYTIPIAVPPGIAGMTPSLTLEYNSQAPNGIVGAGWSLGGLPTITRCATTITQDGTRGAVTFTSADRFCLDGQRLVAISGPYGADGTEYRTEIDSFSRIFSWGSWNGGPTWFEVHTKSGHVMWFGNSPDSQILSCVGPIRAWALNLVSDYEHNRYTVSYQNDSQCGGTGEAYPQTISYAGNTINFYYTGRPDNIVLFEAGSTQKVAALLTNIQTSSPAGGVADYRLAYQQTSTTHRSFLTSVTLCDFASPPNCLPATTIGWNSSGDAFSLVGEPAWGTGGSPPASFAQGDVNGDGCGDVVEYFPFRGTFYVNVILSNCQGGFTGPYTWTTSASVITSDGSGSSGVFLADVDGDGRADLVIYFLDENGMHVTTALSNGTTFAAPQAWPVGTPANWADGVMVQYYGDPPQATPVVLWNFGVVDVDGDGRADLIAYVPTANGIETYVAFSGFRNGGGNFGGPNFNIVPGNYSGATLNLADINGDGRMDVVASFQNANGWQLVAATSVGGGTFSQASAGSFVGFNATGWLVASGDLNGDGRTDFLLYRASTSMLQAYLAFSKGDGTFEFLAAGSCSNPNLPVAQGNFNNWTVSLADFNGDGRADLVAYYFTPPGSGSSESWIYPYLSYGDGTFCGSGGFNSFATGWSMFTPDLNGDGRSDIAFIYFNGSNTALEITPLISQGQALLATSFTTGLGATTTVNYAPLTAPGVYAKGSGAVYPTQDAQGAMYVVNEVNAPTGVSSPASYISTYTYSGARFDLWGRGFLGFAQMNTSDPQTGIYTATGFNQDFPWIGTVVWEQKGIGNQVLNTTNNTYQAFNWSGSQSLPFPSMISAPYRALLSSSVVASNDLDGTALPTVTTTYAYDAYNNPTQISVSTSDGFSKTTSNTYTNDPTNWFLGRLTLAQVTSTAPTPPAPPTSPTPPDMTIGVQHSGNFLIGQTGATYTITARNAGSGATDGMVSVTDTLPSGLAATAIAGSDWTCALSTLTCTRGDALAAGAAYPAITLTVSVTATAPTTVTNAAVVSGGGETNTSNDTATDPTIIRSNIPTKVYLTSGTSWTVPSDWTSSNNTVEVIGGGGRRL
ncbi:MAG: VCBS repeat-containing protein [Hyphomicrobiales bacterium]|nr:VCBS repeat-containing protein [Hyphomicrobiales bacterium]MBV8825754.1 VCBS repeat-containing protein [Hyphomicrobiales bacterium]